MCFFFHSKCQLFHTKIGVLNWMYARVVFQPFLAEIHACIWHTEKKNPSPTCHTCDVTGDAHSDFSKTVHGPSLRAHTDKTTPCHVSSQRRPSLPSPILPLTHSSILPVPSSSLSTYSISLSSSRYCHLTTNAPPQLPLSLPATKLTVVHRPHATPDHQARLPPPLMTMKTRWEKKRR